MHTHVNAYIGRITHSTQREVGWTQRWDGNAYWGIFAVQADSWNLSQPISGCPEEIADNVTVSIRSLPQWSGLLLPFYSSAHTCAICQ